MAQAELGSMYHFGHEVPQNHVEAVKWYRKAAEQGNTLAQCNLGVLYSSGRGVPQNHAEAVKWYRKAAVQGDAAAQFNLAGKYEDGKGVPQNYSEAYVLFSLAGWLSGTITSSAKEGLDRVASELSPEALIAAQQRAEKLFEEIQAGKKAAD